MRAWWRWCVLALVGCTNSTTSNVGSLTGVNDLVLIDELGNDGAPLAGEASRNRFLVVTSTNQSELRVLDLKGPLTDGGTTIASWVAAPNPLEVLSVPVLDRPTTLVLDERYEAGVRRKGQLLYVSRQGGIEISIVGVARSELREIRRLPMPGPVTASAALMKDPSTSRAWFATFDGAGATVWELTLPSTASEVRKRTASELSGQLVSRLRLPGASVTALLAVPGLTGRTRAGRAFCAAPTQTCLVVSQRRLSAASDSTAMFDLATLEAAPLRFPGPVRQLATSDQVPVPTQRDGEDQASFDARLALRNDAPAPGGFVFGVLDEETCGSARCGGVSAVDTRATATDAFEVVKSGGVTTQPVRWNDGLIVGLTLAAGGKAQGSTLPVLGVITTSTGEVVFFDAVNQLLFEGDDTPSVVTSPVLRGGPADGGWVQGPVLTDDGSLAATINDGAFRTQQLSIAWQGVVTPAGGLPLDDGSTSLSLPRAIAARVKAGDTVDCAERPDGWPEPLRPLAVVVSAVGAETATLSRTLPGCFSPRVEVRAGSIEPLVVTGSVAGYLGRAAPGATFRYTGPVAMRLAGVDPSAPSLVIPFGTQTDTALPTKEWQWTAIIQSNLSPLVVQVDSTSFTQTSCPAQLPGALAYDTVRSKVLVLYPSGNRVVEIDPTLVVAGLIGPTSGTICIP